MGDAEGKVMLECESSRRREMVIERPADHLDLLRDSQRASRWKFRLWTHHLAKSIQRQREFKYRRETHNVLQGLISSSYVSFQSLPLSALINL